MGGYKVEWNNAITKNYVRSSVRVDGELITLSDKFTANYPDGEPIKLDFVGRWDQIKLYELDDQAVLAISMTAQQCTGLMCSLGAQFWYDLKSKQKTFFGTYRTSPDVNLYRFPKDERLYTISAAFDGNPHGVTGASTVTYSLYELSQDGTFSIRKDRSAKNYFIRHTIFPDNELSGANVRKRKHQKFDCLEHNWLEPLLAGTR